MVAKGWGWKWVDYRGRGESRSDGNIMLILVVFTGLYMFVKIHRTLYFKRVNFTVCQ